MSEKMVKVRQADHNFYSISDRDISAKKRRQLDIFKTSD